MTGNRFASAILAGMALTLCSCAMLPKHNGDGLSTLAQWMSGDFSSEAQSRRDSDYFDIRLHIRPIWPNDPANIWLYVEQATASAENKPYRQRIYKLEQKGKKQFKSIVYTLPDPSKWIGAYKNPEIFNQLKPEALVLREGCTVFLKRMKNGLFTGKTQGQGCESNIRGAKYAVSTVKITEKMLLSWDQGFNADGKQVWGAEKGGYEFVKQ